jgi:hypothetical protein
MDLLVRDEAKYPSGLPTTDEYLLGLNCFEKSPIAGGKF